MRTTDLIAVGCRFATLACSSTAQAHCTGLMIWSMQFVVDEELGQLCVEADDGWKLGESLRHCDGHWLQSQSCTGCWDLSIKLFLS